MENFGQFSGFGGGMNLAAHSCLKPTFPITREPSEVSIVAAVRSCKGGSS